MKHIFGVVTILLISISVVTGFKGILDSEDKFYIHEEGDYKCLSQKTIPNELTFYNTLQTPFPFYAYGPDPTKCPHKELFNMAREIPEQHSVHIYMIDVQELEYVAYEYCIKNDQRSSAPHYYRYTGSIFVDDIYYQKEREKMILRCQWIRNDNFLNVNYKVTTVPNSTCNFWLCLGRSVVIKQLRPAYPPYTLPADKEQYYFSTDPLPADLQATDDGIAIDIFKASQTTYTVHKMAKRPIQTIEIKTSKHCSGLTVSMTFDGTCEIAVQPAVNQIFYYVNGKQHVIDYRPKELVLTFTYSTAYLYTFDPLDFFPLTGCTFDSSHANNAEYTLKVSYDKSQSVPSCKVAKLRFLEPAAIKRWKPTTTIATTATNTAALTEPGTTEVAASTASTKIWVIVAVVCFAAVIVIVLAVFLTICFIKWRTRTKAPPKSTFDEHASAC